MLHRATTIIKVVALLLLLLVNQAQAQRWTCGKDLDGDGFVDAEGETRACLNQLLCPIEAVACRQSMNANRTVSYSCPLDTNRPCVNDNGTFKCSPNHCVDIDAQTTETIANINGQMLIDNGRRNHEGQCLEQTYIFSGRAMECKKAGKSTAFKNCCVDKGRVFTDSVGSAASIYSSVKTVQKVFDVAKTAYVAYNRSIASGASYNAAMTQATNAAQTQLLVAVDPTSLAVSVAMYFVVDYLTQACDQSDMEAAMLHGSGYCAYIGEYCKHRWPAVGCVQRAKVFCCFNSKMARIIHQQGRTQLRTLNGWGDVSNPNCRGFTTEEFQALDFSKIDLSEYYSDLTHKLQSDMQSQVLGKIDEYLQKST